MNIKGQAAAILSPAFIILLFAILFFAPLKTSQEVTAVISGNGDGGRIVYVSLIESKKPLVDIFSKSDPGGDYSIKIELADEETKNRIILTASGVGRGTSTFTLPKSFVAEGAFDITAEIKLDDEVIDTYDRRQASIKNDSE